MDILSDMLTTWFGHYNDILKSRQNEINERSRNFRNKDRN